MMRKSILAIGVVAVLGSVPGGFGQARAGATDGVTFHEVLARHGVWLEHSAYGCVWQPTAVRGDWRPYTKGHWVHVEEYGLTWVSEYSWGWIPFHYGHWERDATHGWIWIPGPDWAPAWVRWQYGDGYLGWAPLPAGAEWDAHDVAIAARDWSFINLQASGLALYFVVYPDVGALLARTEDVTAYRNVGGSFVNESLDAAVLARETGCVVPRGFVKALRSVSDAPADGARLTTYALRAPLFGGEGEVGWPCPEPERVVVRREIVYVPDYPEIIPSPPWKYLPAHVRFCKPDRYYHPQPARYYRPGPARCYESKPVRYHEPKSSWTYTPRVWRRWP